MNSCLKTIVLLLTVLSWTSLGYGWSCPTHSFIAHQAGLSTPDNACIPDAARYDNYNLLVQFHYHNAAPATIVTPRYIDQYAVVEKEYVPKTEMQAKAVKILVPADAGVLYWKIVELYKKLKTTPHKTEYDYALMTIAHLIGDLSQPLHNFPYLDEPAGDGKVYSKEGTWAKTLHGLFDDRYNDTLPALGKARRSLKIRITSEEELKQEIAKLANASIALATTCYNENQRIMKDEEVADQVAGSIALLKAVIGDTRRVFAD